jgi:hypothetical protein
MRGAIFYALAAIFSPCIGEENTYNITKLLNNDCKSTKL